MKNAAYEAMYGRFVSDTGNHSFTAYRMRVLQSMGSNAYRHIGARSLQSIYMASNQEMPGVTLTKSQPLTPVDSEAEVYRRYQCEPSV